MFLGEGSRAQLHKGFQDRASGSQQDPFAVSPKWLIKKNMAYLTKNKAVPSESQKARHPNYAPERVFSAIEKPTPEEATVPALTEVSPGKGGFLRQRKNKNLLSYTTKPNTLPAKPRKLRSLQLLTVLEATKLSI